MAAAAPPRAPADSAAPARTYLPTLILLASLFFMWGFATVLNNTLLPHLRAVFDLNYTQTTLIESVWFIAYFVASIPSAWLIEAVGYKRSMVTGLMIMAGGAVLMIPAAAIPSYNLVLVAAFIIAGGITLLQVAANPYVAVVGPPETSSSRLNLVQAFNSVGTTLAPRFGAWLILSRSRSGASVNGAAGMTHAQRLADAHSVELPYLLIAIVLAALAVVIALYRLPELSGATRREKSGWLPPAALFRHRNLVFGIPAIFIYLIAEIGCANLFINFVCQPQISRLSHADAGNYLTLLWGGMMVGRFAGGFLMRYVAPERMLAFASVGAFAVMLLTSFVHGPVAMWALISVGLFHSIMFPTIFTLGIKGLGPLTDEGSGLLIMAIAGGALVILQGKIADHFGLQISFLLPAACELYVLFYALWGSRPTAEAAPVTAV